MEDRYGSYQTLLKLIQIILDTKIASKLAGSYSDQHSLKVLIKEFMNIDISKQFQNLILEELSIPIKVLCK